MARLVFCVLLLSILQWACYAPHTHLPTPIEDPKNTFQIPTKFDSSPFYLGGIHVNVYKMDNWLNTLKDVGMNTVEVTVYGKQWHWDTDSLTFDEDKEIEGQLAEIRAAKKKGLKVVVVLRVQLQHWIEKNRFLWHGMILPKNDDLLLSWFEKYTAYNLKWAKICEQEGVDVMVIGSEMNALVSTMPITEIPWLYDYYNSWFRMPFNEKRILKYKEELEDKELWVQGYNLDKNGDKWSISFCNKNPG
ncbi:MAG: glycoside hydrolase family 113 [Chitinophagales bacterium]